MYQVEHGVHSLAPVVQVEPGDGEVVRPPADPDAEHEPTVRDLVEGRRLLGQQDRLARGGQQHVGHQADPLGRSGRRGQGDQLLECGKADPPDRAQGREAERLRAPRDLDQHAAVVEALVRVGKPESDLQAS